MTTIDAPRPGWRRPRRDVLLLGAWIGVCFALRGLFILADAPGVCPADSTSTGCTLRAFMGEAIWLQRPGMVALLLALAAWLPWRGRRILAIVAIGAAAFALVFYNATPGAIAAVLALLAAQRSGLFAPRG